MDAPRLDLLSLNCDEEDQELKRQPKPKPEPEPVEIVAVVEQLDAFLLSLILSHVRDGPTLARFRLVSVWWCKVIDEDKRLWKDLLWRDFGWRKAAGKGTAKGRAKKDRKFEAKGYSRLYGQLFHARRMAALKEAKRERLHAERVARTAALLPELVPLLICKLEKPQACGKRHPWQVCPHPTQWLLVADDGTERGWCRCLACGMEVLVRGFHVKYWREHYPQLLNVVTNEDTRPRYVAGVAAKLHLGTQTSIGADALTAAHDTYMRYRAYCRQRREHSAEDKHSIV